MGCGQHPSHVEMLFHTHKSFEATVGKMGKSGLLKMNENQLKTNMKRNPNQVMSQLQQSMDPNMLAQMGGAGNMMKMMESMGGGGGMGGLGDMMGNPGMANMAQQMMGGGGMPQMGGGPPGAMPDMAQMQKMMQQMGGMGM